MSNLTDKMNDVADNLEALAANRTDELFLRTLHDLLEVAAQLRAAQTATALHAVKQVSLREGDILLVKMGDPATGWIPSREQAAHTEQIFKEALEAVGTRVQLIVHHYGVTLEQIRRGDPML